MSADASVAEFYDEFVDYELGYLRVPNRRIRRAHEQLRPLIRERHPRAALDIGCGVGLTSAWLAKRIDRVVGVDISPRTISVCRRLHPGPEFMVAALPADPLPAGPFDLVTAIDSLEHLPPGDLSALVRGVADELRDEGVFAVNMPSRLRQIRNPGGEEPQVIDEAVGADQLVAAAAEVGMEPLLLRRFSVYWQNDYVFCAFSREYETQTRARSRLRDRALDGYWQARWRVRSPLRRLR